MSNERFVIEGVSYWASTVEVNKLSNKYQVDIAIDDKKTLAKLKKLGINIKEKGEKGTFVTAKSDNKPSVIDAKKNVLSDYTLIGNGSRIKVVVNHYTSNFRGTTYNSLGLNAIQVLELKEYNTGGGLDLFGEEKGYTSDTVTKTDVVSGREITFEDIEDTDLFK